MKLIKVNNRRMNLYFTHKELLDEEINLEEMIADKEICSMYISDIISVLNQKKHLSLKQESLVFQIFPLIEGDLLVSVIKKEEKTDEIVYKFRDVEDVIFVLKNFSASFSGISSIYYYNDDYYLVLGKNNIFSDVFLLNLNEFGEKTFIYQGLLTEHGKCVIKNNACEVFSKYF